MDKTAEEWGLAIRQSYYNIECWICGHLLYSENQKCHGIQESKGPRNFETKEEWEKHGRFQEICSVCLQIQIFNKEFLHKEDAPNCVGGVKRLFLCDPDMKRIAVWEVLDHEPWLEKIQKLPPKEVESQ